MAGPSSEQQPYTARRCSGLSVGLVRDTCAACRRLSATLLGTQTSDRLTGQARMQHVHSSEWVQRSQTRSCAYLDGQRLVHWAAGCDAALLTWLCRTHLQHQTNPSIKKRMRHVLSNNA